MMVAQKTDRSPFICLMPPVDLIDKIVEFVVDVPVILDMCSAGGGKLQQGDLSKNLGMVSKHEIECLHPFKYSLRIVDLIHSDIHLCSEYPLSKFFHNAVIRLPGPLGFCIVCDLVKIDADWESSYVCGSASTKNPEMFVVHP